MTNPAILEQLLKPHGLHLRGVLELTQGEISACEFNAGRDQNFTSIALVGNIGSSFWPVFSQSPEYHDAQPDPLDRWSKRVAQSVAEKIKALAIYPFEGPPYYPFQQWANRAETLHQSPLGLMIHPEYGLWHAYRFGLLIPQASPVHSPGLPLESPCLKCQTQPCLHHCPVDAFSTNGYDVDKCVSYLKQTAEAICHQQGCQARNACPIGVAYRYETAQHLFHLRAFLEARPGG
ncbi:MAG: ferredoxin [Proteobacteria bacterium]|nr:ferredoxin [Pseudomonadota bacterium]